MTNETLRLQRASLENDWSYAKLMRSTWSDGSVSFEVDSNRLGFKSFDLFEDAEAFYLRGVNQR